MKHETVQAGGSFLTSLVNDDSVFTPEEFGEESRLMAQTADDFLRREVLPQTARIESHDVELMAGLMRRAGELGLLGADVPEDYGGLGLDIRTGALLAEKLNWQQSFALTHEAHTVIATLPLLYFGNDAQKRKYLPKLASGEWIGAFCLSETGSGSDALGAQTRADLSADGTRYVLNGAKMWITNTAFADLFTVFAKVGGTEFSTFLVERGTPGLSFGKEEHKLGMRGTSTRRVLFENVAIPVENLVGEVGKGHYAAFCALNMGRFKLEAGAVGGIKETLAACARYAGERKQFGRAIGEFGLIQAKLGEMAARCFALESAVYRLAGLLDGAFAGIDPTADDAPARYHRAAEEYTPECCVVKIVGSELYSWATDEAIQIHGGNGYTEEFPVARAWRDQRLLRIGEGANEIVRLALINTLLRREKLGKLDLSVPTRKAGEGLDSVPALALLRAARAKWGNEVMEEQEVVAANADLVCAAFVSESAWVRARKLCERAPGSPAAALARTAAEAYTAMAAQSCYMSACSALARLEPGVADATIAVARLLPAASVDLIGLRRTLAQAVLQRGGWVW